MINLHVHFKKRGGERTCGINCQHIACLICAVDWLVGHLSYASEQIGCEQLQGGSQILASCCHPWRSQEFLLCESGQANIIQGTLSHPY